MLIKILKIVTVILLLALPYYIFDGKLFLGGDDTRLFYVYPLEFLKYVSYFSWYNVSTIGINVGGQFSIPFLLVWTLISKIIQSKAVMFNLAFSTPLIIGFIFIQKFLEELISKKEEDKFIYYVASLFFLLSPILIINQYFIFLTTYWLWALIPLCLYFFIRYLKTSDFKYVYFASISSIIFSLALFSIPWIFGLLVPVFFGLAIVSFFYKRKDKLNFIKKGIIFSFYILFTQSFWLASFALSYLTVESNSFAQKIISQGFVDTFTPTVLTTATGNIFYPLLNIFHRQIPFDFGWQLKNVFLSFFDKFYLLNFIYVSILIYGLKNYKDKLNASSRKIFILLLISFVFSLYLFTVNIGPLKDLFLTFRHIPGFVMFRNFYDKFAPGFVLLYAFVLAFSLFILKHSNKQLYKILSVAMLLVIIFNFSTVRTTVNSPLWGSRDIYRSINIPEEYLEVMDYVKKNISSTNSILSVPIGTSLYSVVKDKETNNIYVGVSPVKILSGVNDISGHLSFNFTKEADVFDSYIINRDYEKLNEILFDHNINYLLVTNNVPPQVKKTWVFSEDMLAKQDSEFLKNITSKQLKKSTAGNYEIYETRKQNILVQSRNLTFKKISPVKYKIFIKNLKAKQTINFYDSYHGGWHLYLQKNPGISWCDRQIVGRFGSKECASSEKFVEAEDFSFLINKPIFDERHALLSGYANKWQIDPAYIKNKYPPRFYKINKDGSLDVELTMYFRPQLYFYIGVLISLVTFAGGLIYLVWNKYEKK